MKKLIVLLLLIILFTYFIYTNVNNRVIHVSKIGDYQMSEQVNGQNKRIKLMTYNIQHGVGIDSRLDLDRIARLIKQSGADVIGLNEVDYAMKRSAFKNQVNYLAKKLDMNYAFGASVKRFTGSYGNAVLSRYPIDKIENHKLPSITAEKETEKRALLKAEIKLAENTTLFVLNTHLSLDRRERSGQIKWIQDYADSLSEPYILMGDFNTEIHEIHSVLSENGRNSSRLTPLIKGMKTFPAANPSKEIDMFFSSDSPPFTVKRGFTIQSDASDHLPVVLELDLIS